MSAINACPACQGVRVVVLRCGQAPAAPFRVGCHDRGCGHVGPSATTRRLAIARWNGCPSVSGGPQRDLFGTA